MNMALNYKHGLQKLVTSLQIALVCMVLMSCGARNDVRKNVEEMASAPVSIIGSDMECWVPDSSRFPVSDTKKDYTMVVYVDSTQCTPCFINRLTDWNEFVSFEKNKKYSVDFVFILETSPDMMESTVGNLEKSTFRHPVYIDSKCSFRKENPHIPQGIMYHTFLLDKENKVIMVGNPCTSKEIKELFLKCVSGKYK